jgi:hypothetical protein
LRPFVLLLDAGPGVLILILLCIWTVFYIRQLINASDNLLPLMLIAAGLGLLLYGWIQVHRWRRRK